LRFAPVWDFRISLFERLARAATGTFEPAATLYVYHTAALE